MDRRDDFSIDPALVRGWLTARSLARGLPAPVDDHGGYRVDTGSEVEMRRWVFPHMVAGLGELARSLSAPRHFIKYCGGGDHLLAALPAGRLAAPAAGLPDDRRGCRSHATAAGRLSAGGGG